MLPQTSAGAIFQLGIAIGKFQGVIAPTTPTGIPGRHHELVAELGGSRLPEEAPPLACHVVRHVDRFLDVPGSLGPDLAHLLGHLPGQILLALGEELGDAEENLTALRGGHQAPVLVGVLGSLDGSVHVLRRPSSERSPSTSPVAGFFVSNVSPPAASTHSPPM